VNLAASGGVTYAWSPASGLNNPSSCCPTASPSATTIYTVTVTDINGCTASASDTVTVGSTLNVVIPGISYCAGDTGLLVPNLTGPNYKYLWSLESGLNCITCVTPRVFATTAANVYVLTITDTNHRMYRSGHCIGNSTSKTKSRFLRTAAL
jgi:hypothetical protein